MTKRPCFEAYQLESICQAIGATEDGLKGTEIGKILLDSRLTDPTPGITKWKRLYNAFVEFQNTYQCSNQILIFILNAMQPVRYIGKENLFQYRRNEINKRLSFIGIELTEKGGFKEVDKAVTISEAEQRASHFMYKLKARNIHQEIIKYSNAELLVENYFHSVFEAVKSIADRIRMMTGLVADGHALINVAFEINNPLVRLNLLQNDKDRSEHNGLANLIRGLFSYIRNPTAHKPKITFVIEEDDALDIMTVISLIHKRLDKVL